MSVLYLYAVIADRPRRGIGVGLSHERLRVLSCGGARGGVHVVLGRMAAPPDPDHARLRSHHDAVCRIAGTVDAILPVRFGSVVPDEDTAVRLLAPRAAELADRLARVRGREQMTLRLYGADHPRGETDRYAAGGDVTGPYPGAAGPRLGPGARYLARRRARLLAAERVPELEPIRPLIAPLVDAERVERHATAPLLASVYHLVSRGRGAEYRLRLRRAASRLAPLRLTVSGPWPPYAFGDDVWP